MPSSEIKGGTILSRVLNDKYVLVNQLKQYRNYLRLPSGDNRNGLDSCARSVYDVEDASLAHGESRQQMDFTRGQRQFSTTA